MGGAEKVPNGLEPFAVDGVVRNCFQLTEGCVCVAVGIII